MLAASLRAVVAAIERMQIGEAIFLGGCHGTRTQSLGKNLLPPRHSNENRPSVEGAVWPGLGAAVTTQTLDPSNAA